MLHISGLEGLGFGSLGRESVKVRSCLQTMISKSLAKPSKPREANNCETPKDSCSITAIAALNDQQRITGDIGLSSSAIIAMFILVIATTGIKAISIIAAIGFPLPNHPYNHTNINVARPSTECGFDGLHSNTVASACLEFAASDL